MGKINYVTMSTEKLIELAKKRGLEGIEAMSREELIAALKEPKKSETAVIFYWIKVPSYANDTEVWPTGVYRTNAPIERFDRSEVRFVERFDDEIPETVLFEIAKKFGVAIEDGSGNRRTFRDAEDILEEIVIDR